MKEGSTEAPIRHDIPWRDDAYYDAAAIEAELTRVFDICHGCRRCFNLCDSFPRLFDLIDESETGELDSVDPTDYGPVIDACTLCDLCFMTKCPYVPPHEFDLDFPHLMLRARAAEQRRGEVPFNRRQLARTDRNGKLAGLAAPLANWASAEGNGLTRPILRGVMGIHEQAALPKFHGRTLRRRLPEPVRPEGEPVRKVALFATCFANYNDPIIGTAAARVLARNGVEVEVVYPGCCGMPLWEQGDIAAVAANAERNAAELNRWIDDGYDIVAPVPSCALMLKFEWPLISDDPAIRRLSEHCYDISEYIVELARQADGLADGMSPIAGGVTLHLACHARAQNMGAKGAEMLRLIPDTKVAVIERCSGHGGAWGCMDENFEVALKIGKPAARQAAKQDPSGVVVSECPLAGMHLRQGMERLDADAALARTVPHPIVLLAEAYGLDSED